MNRCRIDAKSMTAPERQVLDQDLGTAMEATEGGSGEFCADAATGFFAPSSQLNLLVLSKMR
jgi:hypothetical protein